MKTLKMMVFLLIAVSLVTLGFVRFGSVFTSTTDSAVSSAGSNPASKVDQRIIRAMRAIERMPNRSEGYNQLASAYMQKARETFDSSLTKNADAAITRSLTVEPNNYDALKLRAQVQLSDHRFADALETAYRAQTVRTDDHEVWGQITDALVELGDYPGALKSAQKMVDL